MAAKTHSYVTQTKYGAWRITGTRVSLDSVVHAYHQGQPAEVVAIWFPTLSLEQVHGAIAFYLSRRKEIDAYLAAQSARRANLRRTNRRGAIPLLRRLHKAKQKQTAAARH